MSRSRYGVRTSTSAVSISERNTMIDIDSLAKVLCIIDGQDPATTHNGYDKTWKLYVSQACRTANLYNILYPNTDEEKLRKFVNT